MLSRADYIFVLDPPNRKVQVVGLAKPFPTTKLSPGIPRMGVCGSDHISLCAELAWSSRTDDWIAQETSNEET